MVLGEYMSERSENMLRKVNFKGKDNPFATQLRNLMKRNILRKKTTQEELAKATGISRQNIAQYMEGSSLPNVEKIYYIAKYFNVSADYLIFGIETKETDDHEIKKIKIEDFEIPIQHVTKITFEIREKDELQMLIDNKNS